MTPYLRQICEYLERTGTKLTPNQVERMFGKPTGDGYASAIMCAAAERGYLRSHGGRRERAYVFATWKPVRLKDEAAKFKHLGRDAPRVNSVWQFAAGERV